MFAVGTYILYKGDVCKIDFVKENGYGGKDYYVLSSLGDTTLKIELPVENGLRLFQPIMTKEEGESLLRQIPNIDILEVNEKNLEQTYRDLMECGKKENLVAIMKTTYYRIQERGANKKRISEKDTIYLEKAERTLCEELSICFGISLNQAKDMVKERIRFDVESLTKQKM